MEIPREIFNLTNLTALTLSENKISTLPSGIGNLIKLETIRNNKIVGLSNKMEEKLKKIIEMQVQTQRDEAIAQEMKAQRIAKKNSPITLNEFENLFQTKTEKYLQKKEKSFSNPLDFEKFLKSEGYKQITITRRKQILEGYQIKSSTTSETYNTSKEVPGVQKNYYDEHGFDKDGIHQDTGYLTDKYGNRKDYYTNEKVLGIEENYYDQHGFDKSGIHKDTGYTTDKYGNRKDYYS